MSMSDSACDFLTSAMPESCAWAHRPAVEDLAALPNSPALYLLVSGDGAPVQLATTQALRRLLVGRLTDPERQQAGKTDLAAIARGVRWRPLSTAFEGRWWYYRVAREMYPREYRRLMSFGPARFMRVDLGRAAPDLRVSERIWNQEGDFVGPWPSRKECQEALDGLVDHFDLCRHPEQIHKAPGGTRCSYAEMGRCDAPCDGSVPLAEYVQRCRAAWEFATGGAGEWISSAEPLMRQAAFEQNYESAGRIKHQLEFARRWEARWEGRVRVASELNYFLALPVARRRAWKLVLFRGGHIDDGPVVQQRRIGVEAPAWLRDQLALTPTVVPPIVRMEQTWLICHMLHSRERESAVVFGLPTLEAPADFGQTLSAQAAKLRPPRGAGGEAQGGE